MEFAASIADGVLGRLASYASQEVCLAWGAQLELTKLTKTLTTINLVLQDAEKKQVKNPLITHWLAKLKDVCYDIDDLLGLLEYRQLHHKMLVNNHGRVKGKVRHFFSRWNPTLFNFRLGHRLKDIREKLAEIDDEKKQFGLAAVANIAGEHSVAQRMRYNERETDSLVEPLDIIGRDHDKSLILSHILDDTRDENVSVISIIGLGGLGKTTLTKLVYNDTSVVEIFEVKMWVCVSENFDIRSLVLKIISAATEEKCEEESLDRMKRRLQDTLRGKKFLLVLDDVWDTESTGVTHEKWLGLKSLLSVGADGSKIIVTTRHRSVALLVNSFNIHCLEGLPHHECMSLFIKRAFKKGEDDRYPHLIEIGEDIVKKCGGVPLAVVTLGSMLYLEKEPHQWLRVKDDDMWSIGHADILPALRLSYDALPQHLKPCFAFYSLFPKDYEFQSTQLVPCWVALGYIKAGKENEDLDKTGQDYIRQFGSRSLLEVVADLKTFVIFKMHDLVHDMAISVAQAEYSTVSLRPSSAFEMVRYMSLSEKDMVGEDKQVPNFIFKSTKLRTFIIHGDLKINQQFVKTCISRFKYIRILDLCKSSFKELPSSISKLVHLRMLDLSENREIKRLPNSICKLLSLEALYLGKCTTLVEMPKDIGNLINLRALDITTQQMCLPTGVSHLTSLQQLYLIECVKLKSLGEEMQFLTNLRTLSIENCENLESLPPNMKLLASLNSLLIQKCKQLDLMKTKEGPQGLKFFGITTSDLEVLPTWLEDSANVLQTIMIGECDRLTQLSGLQKFTSLEKLYIGECSNLLALPHCLTELRELAITDCPKLSKYCKMMFKGDDWSKFVSEAKITLDSDSDEDSDKEEGVSNDQDDNSIGN